MITRPITRPVTAPLARAVTANFGNIWSPRALFALGEQGWWFDNSDLSTLFQDAAGTIPVTAAGQPVGRQLDKSGRGNHRYQTTAASRPILRQNATTGAYYLETDGVDDWMQTNAINFTGTDKVTLFTGVRKLRDAAFGMLAELSTIVGANSGSFYIGCPAAGAYEVGRKASGTAAYVPSAIYPAPVSSVISTEIDFSAAQELALFRVNGAATGTPGAVDSGSGNFGNYPAYFFRRGGTSLPFNGHEYGSICVGRLCSAAEIRGIERLLARNTGVTLA